nr:uncharacterized protein LOC106684355 [Halyomorpha halys]
MGSILKFAKSLLSVKTILSGHLKRIEVSYIKYKEQYTCKICEMLLKLPVKVPDMCNRFGQDKGLDATVFKRKRYKIDPMLTILARNGIRCPGPSRKERCKKIKYLPRYQPMYKTMHYHGPRDEYCKQPGDKSSAMMYRDSF